MCYSVSPPARHRRDTRRDAESDPQHALDATRHRRDVAQVAEAAPFTHFLKTRPDHLWHAPPPILARLSDAYVALRARVLVGHVRISSDAMAPWPRPCFSRTLRRRVPSAVRFDVFSVAVAPDSLVDLRTVVARLRAARRRPAAALRTRRRLLESQRCERLPRPRRPGRPRAGLRRRRVFL